MQIIENINKLYNNYGKDKLKTDMHLIVAYWRIFDNVEMSKGEIKIDSLLNFATCPRTILQCKQMYEILKENGEIE